MAVLGALSIVGFIIGIAWLIVSAIRKKGKKIPLIVIAVCLVSTIVAVSNSDSSETSDKSDTNTSTVKKTPSKNKDDSVSKEDVQKSVDKVVKEYDSSWQTNWKDAWSETKTKADLSSLRSNMDNLTIKYDSLKNYLSTNEVFKENEDLQNFSRKMTESINLRLQSIKQISTAIDNNEDMAQASDNVVETVKQADTALIQAISSALQAGYETN
ncbi:hypothetical protein DUK53_14580 [Listeria sp. SHR_NRA_18]|uniref:hypothetical protein n=1 Tax=Listeria sp. SHR_NRA_18 TaxID=2269046 RepID=UPI000F5FBD60|nr:hypothetical protein [Listeria sp. SHR_NRA_18]RQW65837.1 hypothetical protein DUK53_14580 [Listeria sp. SHR_NRA_18]